MAGTNVMEKLISEHNLDHSDPIQQAGKMMRKEIALIMIHVTDLGM